MAEKTHVVAGIALEGAQAELGKLLTDNIKYAFVIKQLRAIHKKAVGATVEYPCACGKNKCPSIGILQALDV